MLCRDRSSPLCHIRVGLTSCIGAGHIVFFAGIDSTGNQVTCWTSTFVVAFLMLPFLCLFIYLFVLSYPPSFWFKDRLIYRVILFSWLFVSFCLHSFYVCCNFPLFSFNSRSVFFGLCIFLFFVLTNTICRANYYILTDYLFLAGCLCSCGSSYAVFPDGQFLLDACRGDLYLLICCKGLQNYRQNASLSWILLGWGALSRSSKNGIGLE